MRNKRVPPEGHLCGAAAARWAPQDSGRRRINAPECEVDRSGRGWEDRPEVAGDRERWRDLSLEKKLGVVIVPLAVALIGVGVPRILDGHSKDEPPLEVVDFVLTANGSADITVVNSGK